jgi:hypothetical protein
MAASPEHLADKLAGLYALRARLRCAPPEHTKESLLALPEAELRALFDFCYPPKPLPPRGHVESKQGKRYKCDY